jgi:hypothetical protein
VTSPPSVTSTPKAPAPIGVAVTSVTFVSASHGWLIGTTAGRTRVETTTGGGGHWSPLAAVPPGSPAGIRFGDAAHGYAFSRQALDLTADGGQSWQAVAVPDEDPGDGDGAAQVEIASGAVWLLNAADTYPSIYEAPIGSSDFHKVGTAGNRGAVLSLQGPYAYIGGQQGTGPIAPGLKVAEVTGIGANEPVPCTGLAGTGDAGALTPLTTPGQLILACTPQQGGTSTASSVLHCSTNNGGTWLQIGAAACAIKSLTRTSTAVFGACPTGIVRLPLTGGSATTSLGAPSLGYVGFTNHSDGVATGTTGQPGALYFTRDGGQNWSKAVT